MAEETDGAVRCFPRRRQVTKRKINEKRKGNEVQCFDPVHFAGQAVLICDDALFWVGG